MQTTNRHGRRGDSPGSLIAHIHKLTPKHFLSSQGRTQTHTHAQVYKEHRFGVENTHTLVQHVELVFSPAGMCFTVHVTNMPPVVAYSCNGTVPHLTINTLLSAHLLKYDSRPPLWSACLFYVSAVTSSVKQQEPSCVRLSQLSTCTTTAWQTEDRVEELVSVLHVCSGRRRCFSDS